MTFPKEILSLIDFLESELANTYKFSLETRAADFLITEDHFETQDIQSLPRAAVLISQHPADEMELGVFLNQEVVSSLVANKPLEGLSSANLDAFCVLAEEISHFHLLVNRARRRQGVSRLELEWQGEVDKVWLAGSLLRTQIGVTCFHQLTHLIFERGEITSSEEELYLRALHYAAKYWQRLLLRGKASQDLQSALKAAYHLQWPSKVSLIQSA